MRAQLRPAETKVRRDAHWGRYSKQPQVSERERQTLEQWLEAGGRITQCEPVTGDPAAAIQRARKVRAELKFPRSPKNSRRGDGHEG